MASEKWSNDLSILFSVPQKYQICPQCLCTCNFSGLECSFPFSLHAWLLFILQVSNQMTSPQRDLPWPPHVYMKLSCLFINSFLECQLHEQLICPFHHCTDQSLAQDLACSTCSINIGWVREWNVENQVRVKMELDASYHTSLTWKVPLSPLKGKEKWGRHSDLFSVTQLQSGGIRMQT